MSVKGTIDKAIKSCDVKYITVEYYDHAGKSIQVTKKVKKKLKNGLILENFLRQ